MNIEARLKNYKTKKSIVNTIEIRIKAYEQMLSESQENCFTIVQNSEVGMPKAPSRQGSPVERAVITIECDREDVKEIIKSEKSRLFWPKLEVEQIETALEGLTAWERHVIELKYFNGMTWRNIEISFNEQFPQKNDLTEERIRQINREAIKKLDEILQPFYKQYESIYKLPENYQKTTRKLPVFKNSKVYTYNMGKLE